MLARRVLFAVLLAAIGIPRSAQATKVSILTDSRVAQYRDALSAVKDVLQDAPTARLLGLEVPEDVQSKAKQVYR